jgi:unsaturated rhamnogalacturonyl hydrolase
MKPESVDDELVSRAAHLLIKLDWKVWYFGDNAGFWGLQAATELTGDGLFSYFGYGLVKAWSARRSPRRKYDQTLPGVECLELAERFGDNRLIEALIDHAEWLCSRTREDGVYLTDDDYPRLIWVDTLAVHAPFLAGLGRYDPRYYRRACEFLMPNVKLLQDGTGLFCHTYDVDTRNANGVHWGRGQGWAMAGLFETWKRLPSTFPQRAEIALMLKHNMDSLIRLQRADGHWHTIIDDERSYVEPSVAAFYVLVGCRALTCGLISQDHIEHLERAWIAVKSSFSEEGRYVGVSEDTWTGEQEYYRSVGRNSFSPWSQGPAVAAMDEYNRFRKWMAQHGHA